MFSPRLSSFRRHAPVLLILALVGCKGGGGSNAVAVVSEAAPTSAGPTPAPVPAPSPAPSETPTPSPDATTAGAGRSIPSDGLSGVEAVASGVDVSKYLVKSWGTGEIPKLENLGVEGAFRFICAPSHNAYDDPIVYPGQPGRAHLHTFFGNTKADAHSTYRSLRTTGESTCNNLLNRSAYWIPAMMNGSGRVVMPDYIAIYYKRPPQDSKFCAPPYAQRCLPLPHGLRYLFGYDMANPAKSDPAHMRWFNCDAPGAVSGHFATMAEALKGCPAGGRIGAVIMGPNCWNGRELDSPDHRSHMAYQVFNGQLPNAVCPATHPYLLPFFQLGAWYKTDGTTGAWHFSSDRMAGMPNLPAGTSFHADWFGAWEEAIMSTWTRTCIDKSLSCAGGDLGNGQQLDPLMGYNLPNASTLVDPPEKPQ